MRRIFRVTCQREERGRRLHCDPRYEGRHKLVIATSTLYVLVLILFFQMFMITHSTDVWNMKLAIDSFCLQYFPGTSPTFSQLMASFLAFTQWLPNSPTFPGFLGFQAKSRWTVRGCFPYLLISFATALLSPPKCVYYTCNHFLQFAAGSFNW